MNEKLTIQYELEIIESIIYTFHSCAYEELRPYRFRTNSLSGTLLIRVLDDLSGFLFTGTPRERIGQFVTSYLPKYADLPVYDTLKNSLRYNYVVATTGPNPLLDENQDFPPIGIYDKLPVPEIIEDLEEALPRAFDDLRNNPEKRQVALERYKTHKVCHWPCSIYTEAQKQKLRDYYLPLLKANSLIKGRGEIGLYFSPRDDQNYLVLVEIEDLGLVQGVVTIPLELVIAWMGLRKVEEVLGL